MEAMAHKNLKEPIIITTYQTQCLEDYINDGGYETLKNVLTKYKPNEIIEQIKASELLGRGGAAFPTGIKWDFTAQIKADHKFVVCNADEGEPGTFKDRWILEHKSYSLIEAMSLCAYSVGGDKGYIYIRGEYTESINSIRKALKEAYDNGFLGENILKSGFSFNIELRRGDGSYVCGEETALIESIEGKRAFPRFKPPFPGIKGLWGYPTVINNVETFANIVPIIKNGADWFKNYGTEHSSGTKLYSISGSVNKSGIIEANLGVTLKELLDAAQGMKNSKTFKCALIGGASGGFVYKDELDLPLSYETLKKAGKTLGSGAVLFLSEDDNEESLLKNILTFFKHESCGKCTPCREGYPKLIAMYEAFLENKIKAEDIMKLADVMFKTSLCALGQSVRMPLETYLSRKYKKL